MIDLEKHGIEVKSQFVPWSQSRNFKPDANVTDRSLNWRVTLVYNGLPVLTTDYMAGIGHCDAYKAATAMAKGHVTMYAAEFVIKETETGIRQRHTINPKKPVVGGKAYKPDPDDVVYSLLSDSEALDYSGFEEWANCFGYDPDSRKAETIYKACMDLALQMRNGLGETRLAALREMFQDY